MATVKLYLDARRGNNDTYPIKLCINHQSHTAMVNINVSVTLSQWEKKSESIINHPQKNELNRYIRLKKMDAEEAIREYSLEHSLRTCTANELREVVLSRHEEPAEQKPLFKDSFDKFVKMKSEGTKRIYMETYSLLCKYTDIESLTFEEITREWLTVFDRNMELRGMMTNTRGIHLRNIRAVFNYALDEEIINIYPFRRFKIKKEATAKRSLTVEELRTLFNYPVEEYAEQYRDMFMLIFMLIGINIADLTHLKKIQHGRIEYNRAKTHRHYSIKVEPEAMAIINKYKGRNWLLSPLDHYQSYVNYVAHMNTELQKIGKVELVKEGRVYKKYCEPLFPNITTYWARHTWATIASELDISKETIAKALGHGGNSVTDIYIDYDMKKVDEANRKVLDWVLYGKK